VRVGAQILIVGGYDGAQPLRSVLGFRPGHALRQVATLPHPLRYAAAAAAGSQLLVAGGTDGVHARREILRIDPATHRTTRIGRLGQPLAHVAGAVLNGTFYVFGGRGDSATSAHRAIWAIDPRTGRTRRAGQLPLALSDLSAATLGKRILVVGGRGADGHVAGRILEYAER
jgi:N-acetylneuraminic acid mutarotase